jgi:hypothetical protein
MFRRLLACCLVSSGALLTALASAQEKIEKLPPPIEKGPPVVTEQPPAVPMAPAPDCCTPTVEQTFPVMRIQIVEEQELVTVPRIPVREEVTKVPIWDIDVDYREEKRCCTILVPKPRMEERQVSSVSLIPETTIDPCTGCPCTTVKEIPVCKTVQVEVMDIVPETHTYLVKVPVLKPVQKLAVVKRVVIDHTTVGAVVTHFKAIETSSKVTVPVPACPASCCPLDGEPVHGEP